MKKADFQAKWILLRNDAKPQNAYKLGHLKNCRNYPKIWTMLFYYTVVCQKAAEKMKEQSELGLYCSSRPVCPKNLGSSACMDGNFIIKHVPTRQTLNSVIVQSGNTVSFKMATCISP